MNKTDKELTTEIVIAWLNTCSVSKGTTPPDPQFVANVISTIHSAITNNENNRNLAHTPEYKLIYDLLTVAMRNDLQSLRQ